MKKKNILLLSGGGSTEHNISLVSVKHIEKSLMEYSDLNLISLVIEKNGDWIDSQGEKYFLDFKSVLHSQQDASKKYIIDYAIPCIHGHPGETGDIQSYFEMIQLHYLGCNSETNKICFNKITTKLWATALGVPNTPYLMLTELNDNSLDQARKFQKYHGDIVVKASNQGSSVGCYLVEKDRDPLEYITNAFTLSPYVLIEKRLFPRELEVSVYQFQGEIHVTYPGEIVCPSKFYSFEEKYSEQSKTYTLIKAENLSLENIEQIRDYAKKLASGLKLKDLSRIDFFLADGIIYLNEINTFPGLTPISMFPKMMEANGHLFKNFLYERIQNK
jgi:D-alanine-D-alanine ligase